MSISPELAGNVPAKLPEKPSFSRTCSLLSKYLKENKAAFGDLNLAGKSEMFQQAVTPMNLFPENPLVDSTPKNQPKSVDLLPQFADSSEKVFDATEEAKAAQMTIFYGGQVIVFNDFPADKAKEIMLLASKGSNSQVFTPQPTFAPQIPNPHAESNTKIPPSPIQRPLEPIACDLPMARRHSLHRFLEKRKDRVISRSPYPVAPMSASSGPADNKPWLSLAASE